MKSTGRAIAAVPPKLPPNKLRDGRSPASHAHTPAPTAGTNQGGAATPPYLSAVGRSLPRRPTLSAGFDPRVVKSDWSQRAENQPVS